MLQNIKINTLNFSSINKIDKPVKRFATCPVADRFEKKQTSFDEELKALSNIKQSGKPRFSQGDITCFSHISPDKIHNVKYFANTNLAGFNIKWIIEKNDVNFEKLGNIIQNEESKDKEASIDFVKDYAQDKNYILSIKGQDYEINKLLDKDLNILSEEKTVNKKDYKFTEVKDYQNNSTIKAKTDNKGILLSSVKTYKDKNNNIVKTEVTEQSEITGIYNTKVKNSNGTVDVISEGKIDKNTGISTVNKNMTSYDGTKTEYQCKFDTTGNRETHYKITDKNGKILLDNKEKFKKIDENTAISEKNGETYKITYSAKSININHKNKLTEIDLYNFTTGDISPMKNISGNELIQMKNNIKKYNGNRGSFAAYDIYTKEVNTSDNKVTTLLHELGHAKDYRNKDMEISGNKDFEKIFEEEKALFSKNSSNFEIGLIGYFIRPKCHHAGENGGKVETVAEVNAILNACSDDNETAMRKHLLQQYFPRTISVLSKNLDKISETPLIQKQIESFGH